MARVNMPQPVKTGNIIRISVYYVTDVNVQITLFDYMNTAGATTVAADVNNIASVFATAAQAQILACISPMSQIQQYIAQDISEGIAPSAISPVGVVGTAGTTYLPLEMQAGIRKLTSLKGQHGYGRVQMPAVPTTFTTPATDPNKLNAAGTTAYLALSIAMQVALTVGAHTYKPVVSTRIIQPKPPLPPISPLITHAGLITGTLVDGLLGTQRRRRPGRGI